MPTLACIRRKSFTFVDSSDSAWLASSTARSSSGGGMARRAIAAL
jgi:hypothetical protein